MFPTFCPELELDDGVDARQDEAQVAQDGRLGSVL